MAQFKLNKSLVNLYLRTKYKNLSLWSKINKHSIIYHQNENLVKNESLIPVYIDLNTDLKTNKSYRNEKKQNYYHFDINIKLAALGLLGFAFYSSIKSAECESINKSDKELCNFNNFTI